LFKIPNIKVCLALGSYLFTDPAGRGDDLKKILDQLATLFKDHINAEGSIDNILKDCLTVVVTKADKNKDYKEEIQNMLVNMSLSEVQKNFLKIIADRINIFRRATIADGINLEDKERILNQLSKTEPIRPSKLKFSKLKANIVLSQKSQNQLKSVMDKVHDGCRADLRKLTAILKDKIKTIDFIVLEKVNKALKEIIKDRRRDQLDLSDVYSCLRIMCNATNVDDTILSGLISLRDCYEFANAVLPESYNLLHEVIGAVYQLKSNIWVRMNSQTQQRPYDEFEYSTTGNNFKNNILSQISNWSPQ
jgi:hypothetical protein